MAINIMVGLALALGIVLLIWSIRGLMLTPVKDSSAIGLTMLVRLSGADPGLEHCLDGLIWLRENGTIKADIRIEAIEPDEATRHICSAYVKDYRFISFTEYGDCQCRNLQSSTEQ